MRATDSAESHAVVHPVASIITDERTGGSTRCAACALRPRPIRRHRPHHAGSLCRCRRRCRRCCCCCRLLRSPQLARYHRCDVVFCLLAATITPPSVTKLSTCGASLQTSFTSDIVLYFKYRPCRQNLREKKTKFESLKGKRPFVTREGV